ncbi:ABC transporter permease [Tomitella gaofuii]|uniref:ABC transporter permease n=1 Tax=Tomitella gaofuii TaxID=2760083 RepID=UPI0015F8BBF3|nr:ABC transporter permease [Tomitella gaofuii]
MTKYLVQRVLSGAALVFVLTSAIFFLVRGLGPNPAEYLAGDTATADQVSAIEEQIGVDRPLVAQYGDWFGHFIRGDLGSSWTGQGEVAQTISASFPITLSIAVGALAVALVLGFGIGTLAAARRGALDRFLQVLVIVGLALPGFWLALMLAQFFAVDLGWFPATGYTSFSESPVEWLRSITLPVIGLTVATVAAISQQVRNSVIEVSGQDFVRTLRARGLPTRSILLKHVLRNAAGAPLTVAALHFVTALSGAVAVERAFGLHGIGNKVQIASISGDAPTLMSIVALTVILVVLVNLATDVLLAWLNPKVRIS